MSELQLSKDNDLLICTLYKTYLEKRKSGMSKSAARLFDSSDYIQETLLTKWSKEDVSTACWELNSQGILDCFPGDDLANDVYITDKGIIYMETRFSNKFEKVVDYISKFIP